MYPEMRKFEIDRKVSGDFWQGRHAGYDLCLMRNPRLLHWCGYVRVSANAKVKEETLDVHGGVTFDGFLKELGGRAIGFDCAHAGDYVPGNAVLRDGNPGASPFGHGEYRDRNYAMRQLMLLGSQLWSRGVPRRERKKRSA